MDVICLWPMRINGEEVPIGKKISLDKEEELILIKDGYAEEANEE
ncbi:hypothetical protein [Chengkuizengella axinellae]|uniref:Uncharacterized protein n=1 Tax=Chengkuizengella axinellae TaxID=3064388 RepID=A0ABT9IYB2_9BACL|nr:hypothetical protein [Chengkuizengella sp. 2205SS18-9]MDP5274339.1 hypothetical protein [Chengkuizengella sp. 2205SS18-9]